MAEERIGSMVNLKHRLVRAAKKWIFATSGEPYRIKGKTLRFYPGTRPVRLHYQTSLNSVNRYDAIQLSWILSNLVEGDVAIDVGANFGQCTLLMAEKCGPSGCVIAFEPNPFARDILARNFDLNPTVKRAVIEPVACADVVNGEVDFFHNGNPANSALVPSPAQINDANKCFRVPVTTLDHYLAQREMPEPRCVKIDTEGAEIRVLQGARNILLGKATILCELHPYAWPQFGNSLRELEVLLTDCGRRMRYLDQKSEPDDFSKYGIVELERVL